MPFTSRPLLAHQQAALAAASGLVGRPRLAAGLALTLACACGPLPDDNSEGSGSGTVADSSSSAASSTGELASTGHDSGHSGTGDTAHPTTGDDTLLTEAGTTLATTTTDDLTTSGSTTDPESSSTADPGTTGELDDCFLDTRTMEVDWDCCEQQNWLPSPQCTPWGPPAPPVAAGRLPAARLARRLA